MSNAIKEIVRFQVDRGLHKKPYQWVVETTNIVEELFEGISVKDRGLAEDIVLNWAQSFSNKVQTTSKDEAVDAFADIIVFATGAIMKLGYDPELVLREVGKEINSRTGRFVDGKFRKDTSEEAKARWYKADFSKCKFVEVNEEIRTKFFDEKGYEASDEAIANWYREKCLNVG